MLRYVVSVTEYAKPPITTFASPLKASIPARVAMKGGTLTKAIQKPCHMPMRSPITSITITATGHGMLLSIMMAPTPPAKQTTEPTARSMLPPVRMQRSIPVARTNT